MVPMLMKLSCIASQQASGRVGYGRPSGHQEAPVSQERG